MENEKLKRRKVLLTNSIMPWFIGLSDDLMFFIAINSMFFTVVKGLSASQITFLTTVSSLSYVLLQIPFLKIIQKVGNIKSIRIGTFMLLISSILMTFGKSYLTIVIGHILYTVAFLFKTMDNVLLEGNLRYLNRQDKYIKIAGKAKIIYSTITTIIAFFAGGIFAINYYLPMYLCIAICVINFLLTYCMFDVNENTKKINKVEKKEKIKISSIMWMIFISFGFLYAIITTGQGNSKLFIQYDFQKYFDTVLTATYLGFIVATSRIARIFGNIVFHKLYNKYEDKVNLILPIIVMIAFFSVILGSLCNIMFIKFILMTIGFDLILASRDPVDLYLKDILFKKTKEEMHQIGVSYMQLSRRISEAAISLLFVMILMKLELIHVIICLIILALISLGINAKLYKMIKEQ